MEKKNESNKTEIPICFIEPKGVYKYVQINYNNQIYIRGIKKCKYHKGIYHNFIKEIEKTGIQKPKTKCLGGGRIKFEPEEKNIFVYGYSNAYGRYEGQHEKTVEILKNFYPDYNITWSNEGY